MTEIGFKAERKVTASSNRREIFTKVFIEKTRKRGEGSIISAS